MMRAGPLRGLVEGLAAMTHDARYDPQLRTNLTNLSWLLRLRWGAVAGQLITILAARFALDVELPLPPLLALVGVEALSNAILHARPPARVATPALLGGIMALDVLLLSGLLYFTGGPNNPFSFLFLVSISLATLILPAAWTWALVLLSLACSAVLFAWNRPLDLGPSHAAHMMMHLRGMWVAFGVAAAFIVYFVRRIRRALEQREAELEASRVVAARQERLASLATLAAGAAHELSTPLSTIAVVARELERGLAALQPAPPAGVADDVRLVREEVARCRAILERMCVDAGQVMGEAFVSVRVDELVGRALAGLEPRPEIRADLPPAVGGLALDVPPRAVEQALQGVLRNAQDASPAGRPRDLRRRPRRRARRVHGPRRGRRHGARRRRSRRRAVLHDEARRPRHGPRPLPRAHGRRAPRRRRRARERARPGYDGAHRRAAAGGPPA